VIAATTIDVKAAWMDAPHLPILDLRGGAGRLAAHPARATILAELHARPSAPVSTPCRILHFAFATDFAQAQAARAAFDRFCAEYGLDRPAEGAKHHRVEFSGCVLRWESHSEFTTYDWQFAAAGTQPFQPAPDTLAGVMSLVPQPGPLLVAIDLHLLPAVEATVFSRLELAASEVEDGAASIATDFKADPHGFVRILVGDRRLSPMQAGGLVQRLIEIETYRSFALLGLIEAQRLTPSVHQIETELPLLLERIQSSQEETNRATLSRLLALAAELEKGAAESLFRFGATRAYAALVQLRLDAIAERPIPGVPSWSAFLSRRMGPAIRTCATMEERQANLSRKLARAAQLLRTRVEIELQSQNRDLLHGVSERGRVQLRLQQTVEGLSVAAISYYIVSLVHLLLEGVHTAGVGVDPLIGTAASIPVVVLGIAWIVRRIRRRHAGSV